MSDSQDTRHDPAQIKRRLTRLMRGKAAPEETGRAAGESADSSAAPPVPSAPPQASVEPGMPVRAASPERGGGLPFAPLYGAPPPTDPDALPPGYEVTLRTFTPSDTDRSQHGLSPPPATWAAPEHVAGLGAPLPRHKIVFFDIETSGLRNTDLIVCYALGWWTSDQRDAMFHVKHYLCLDPHAEADMLQALLDELTAFHMICTYNGKSFDLPRTRSRCLHHQLDPTPLTRLRHVDLVHTARQKLSKLDHKLSLGMMEQVLLQFTRHGDLPGSEVPRRWFQFLASQNASLLDEIREHNLIDVVSLAALLERFVQRAPLPGAPPSQQALPLAKSQPEAPPQLAARQPPAQLAAMSPLQKKLTRSYELHALSASRPRATRSTDESEGGEEARDTLTSTRDWRIGPRVVTLIQHLQLKLDAGDPITAHPLLIMELAALAPQHLQVLEWLATYYDRLGATHCAEAIRQRAP